jgi:hypothetical protein
VRTQVNDLLATGSSYAMVLRTLGEDKTTLGKGDRVTIDSVRNHAARHFPVQQVARATYREIVERRAREAQIDFVNGVATALTPMAFYECVMNEAFRRLVDGDVDVSVDTGLLVGRHGGPVVGAVADEVLVGAHLIAVGCGDGQDARLHFQVVADVDSRVRADWRENLGGGRRSLLRGVTRGDAGQE